MRPEDYVLINDTPFQQEQNGNFLLMSTAMGGAAVGALYAADTFQFRESVGLIVTGIGLFQGAIDAVASPDVDISNFELENV